METSFAPWSFWVLCVHPAFGGAGFSAPTNGREHQLQAYRNCSVINDEYEWVGKMVARFAAQRKKRINLMYNFYLYKLLLHLRSASNFH